MGLYVSFLVSQNQVNKCKIKGSNPIEGIRFFFSINTIIIVLGLCDCQIFIYSLIFIVIPKRSYK